MRLIITAIFTQLSFVFIAQGLTTDGGALTVQNAASVTIQGNLLNTNNGSIDNSGEVLVSQYIINNGGNTLFINSSPGVVELNGNHQFIGGSDTVLFNVLKLAGQNLSIKELEQNIGVTQLLDLNNQELQLNQNIVYVTNPSVNAVIFNSGYVSGDSLGGYLWRTTNSNQAYIFPVGSSLLTPEIRPVIITPDSNTANAFAVRLAAENCAYDQTGVSYTGATGPFDPNTNDQTVRELNTSFYHNIAQPTGNSTATVNILYATSDGDFQTVAQWQNNLFTDGKYQPLFYNGYGLDMSMQKNSTADFNTDIFVLSEVNLNIQVPEGVSYNGDGLNDALKIDGLEYYPDNELLIFNRWGDLIYQSTPYQNNWSGDSNVPGRIGGTKVVPGTYYYVLKLNDKIDPITGYIELKY